MPRRGRCTYQASACSSFSGVALGLCLRCESRGRELAQARHPPPPPTGCRGASLAPSALPARRNEFDAAISETEGAYMKILESSQTLLSVLKRESTLLTKKKTGV